MVRTIDRFIHKNLFQPNCGYLYLGLMSYLLRNKNLEIEIDFPLENYNFSRFDWTGKIVSAKYRNITFASAEDPNDPNQNHLGKGFYNEFGIESPLGFDETKIGDWFHKMGVGLLQKENAHYSFHTPYKVKPAEFHTSIQANQVELTCISALVNGFAYELRKKIELLETGFTIKYALKNTGRKMICTDEYVHNFTAINTDFIGKNYNLNFPFDLKPKRFEETINSESAVSIGEKEITFNGTPNEPFFFSNLSGGKKVPATWELINETTKLGIREKASFETNKINLWGCKHVISPELFFDIRVAPGDSTKWTRSYEFFNI